MLHHMILVLTFLLRENSKMRIWAISLSTDKVSVGITLNGAVAFRNLHQSKINPKFSLKVSIA